MAFSTEETLQSLKTSIVSTGRVETSGFSNPYRSGTLRSLRYLNDISRKMREVHDGYVTPKATYQRRLYLTKDPCSSGTHHRP